jgi:DNA polymerase III subunit delta
MNLSPSEAENNIIQRAFHPLYFFFGAEAYFIDRLANLLIEKVLTESEASFNLDKLYGPDVTAQQIIAIARAYPIMAERRLIVVKESHRMRKDQFEKLLGYIQSPAATTILVFLHKSEAKPDQRTKFGKTLFAYAHVVESKRLYENQVEKWIGQQVSAKGYNIMPDAVQLILLALGTNLQSIDNELHKIYLHLQTHDKKGIDKQMVYDFVSIDKDYNIFELINQIGQRNAHMANLIIQQMTKNTKENVPTLVVSQLYAFFLKLLMAKQMGIEQEGAIAKLLEIHPFIAKQYVVALQRYRYAELEQRMELLYEADLALKGIQTTNMGDEHILRTLVLRLVA